MVAKQNKNIIKSGALKFNLSLRFIISAGTATIDNIAMDA
jgi:hypothetical protein